MNELTLLFPTPDMEEEALAYRQEYFDWGENTIHGSGSLLRAENYESWLDRITKMRTEALDGLVTGSTYFAIVGDKIIGTIQIRHTLNDFLINYGGHIGYSVRPSQRRKGYGAKMLALALIECKKLGIEQALVTCDKDNPASARTILKNGGILDNEITEDNGNIVQRYWIRIR